MMRLTTRSLVSLALFAVAFSGCGGSGDVPSQSQSSETGDNVGSKGGVASGPKVPKAETDPLHPVVDIKTSLGVITVELDAVNAPTTVHNFLTYVGTNHYEDTVFHYVDGKSMILGGGFTPDLASKQGAVPIRNEAHNGIKNTRGTIAMSRDFESIDSATCQFFINLTDNPHLDHQSDTAEEYGYCVFGKVLKGLEIAEQIAKTPTVDEGQFASTPKERMVIQSVRRIR